MFRRLNHLRQQQTQEQSAVLDVRWMEDPVTRLKAASVDDNQPGTLKTKDYDQPQGQCSRQ
jgi:hypothetical protein